MGLISRVSSRTYRKKTHSKKMAFHDEIEIEDMTFDEDTQMYHYPCPCGDQFEVSLEDLKAGEEVATCPSCSLIILVIYDPEMFDDDELDDLTEKVEAITV